MFRRTVLDQTNGYNESNLVNRSEDYDLLMRAYQRGFVGANLDNELYYIRLDKNTYKRRKYRFRINESIVKWNGFSRLGLMPLGILFAIKPLIVGLIPSEILKYIKKGIYRSVK
ncbi:putative glycosyltransferase EpsE [compost metagenome]